MVKGLRVMDSQDITRDKSDQGATAVAKRKKVLLESDDEIEAGDCVPSVVKESPSIPSSNLGPEKKISRNKRHSTATRAQARGAVPERPKRACVSTNPSTMRVKVEPKPQPSVVVDQFDSNEVKAEKELPGGEFR